MNQIKGLLIDIDGVLIEDGQALEGAVDRFNELKQSYELRLLTNTTTKRVANIHQSLVELGFNVELEDIITAPVAARLYLESKGITSLYPVVHPSIRAEFDAFEINKSNPDAIIVGDIGKAWNYDLMNELFKCLMNGSELIALHKGKFWKSEGELQLDIGSFIVGLEYASGKNATVVGKPSFSFFESALSTLSLAKDEVLMIGDDIYGDIQGAQTFGLKAYLVQTGKYNEAFVAQSGIVPDKVIQGFKDFQ